jgi:site-specific DNA recombinase
MKTAIYSRVSTENQEKEGTSLQTQLEACLKYCQDKGYDVSYRFSEAYSGLSLERPELDKLRELVRTEALDVLVCYSLDRLTRDPGHGVIITQELEKYGVKLEAVTEDVDNTELGKLITYIKGFAAKLDAERRREATLRGRKACSREGRMAGGFHITFGYDYVRVIKGEREARRVINETEASWVRQMYGWLVNEGLSNNQILFRLRAHNAPTKSGKIWNRRSVLSILNNPAYTGKTYAFTSAPGRKQYTRPREEWIEIPGVTPAIISQETFDEAQKRLRFNRERSSRNCKHEYLLRGHLRCRQCGRVYVGEMTNSRTYRCAGRKRAYAPVERCCNKGWRADKLEAIVWDELSAYLGDRDLIIAELEKEKQAAGQTGAFETELKQVERQLKAADHEQHQLLQWALKGFPENQVEAENQRLNKAKETLKAQKTELEAQLKASQNAVINVPNLERFIEDMQKRLPELDFEGKRLALDMLDITVWLDHESVEVTGTIDPESGIVRTPSSINLPLSKHHHQGSYTMPPLGEGD